MIHSGNRFQILPAISLLLMSLMFVSALADDKTMVPDVAAYESANPDTIQELYSQRYSKLGQVAGLSGTDALKDAIAGNLKNATGSEHKAVDIFKAAEQLVAKAQDAANSCNFEKGVKLLEAAQHEYLRSYVASVRVKPGEIRAVFCCDPRGPGDGHTMGLPYKGWDPYIKALARGGFNAVVPVMSYAGAAAYKSNLLPLAAFNYDKNTDSLAECVAAGKKCGVKVFAAKCNYWLWDKHFYPNDKSLFPKLVAENRLQVTNEGELVEDHICPSHPENIQLEVDTFLELVKNYDVAGIMFDFIRYGGEEHCFCSGCRERFEAQYKLKVKNWPADVFIERGAVSNPLKEKYRQFRRDNITAVVAAVSREARIIRPGVLITAAVITDGRLARDVFGQDWKLWLEKGYLDFACPMIYSNPQRYPDPRVPFEASFRADRQWAGPKAKLVPSIREDWWPLDQTLARLVIARKYGADGFVLWHYVDPERYKSFFAMEAAEETPYK